MAAPSIGGVAFGSTMGVKGGGRITPHWQDERVAADGSIYRAGEQWLEWDWPALLVSDYDYLVTRYEALPSTFELFDDDTRGTAVSFTSGGMKKPTSGGTFGGKYYRDVHVEFRSLMPTLV